MPVDKSHSQYSASILRWARGRDVIEGEDQIKDCREKYVPRLSSQNDDEYHAYIRRGLFFNASARTLQGLSGMVFRQDPVITVPDDLKPFLKDADMGGCEFYSYAKMTLEEVLTVGRGGSLVDWNQAAGRAQATYYAAESIINWEVGRVKEKIALQLLVLAEVITIASDGKDGDYTSLEEVQYRVFRLLNEMLVVEVWKEKKPNKANQKTKEFVLESTSSPLRRGKPLDFIPFVFHNTKNHGASIDRPPLDDLFIANVSHFQLNVEFRHGLHYTGLPTAWVAGFEKNTIFTIGSSIAWVASDPTAKAGFLEFTGQGLGAYTTEMEKVEHQMAILGARMLEKTPTHAVSPESLKLRAVGENASLTDVAGACSVSLSKVLKLASWWLGQAAHPEDIDDKEISIELNTEFAPTKLAAPEIIALVKAWQAGGMSKETLVENFQQGGLLVGTRTVEEEIAMIDAAPPPVLPSAAPKDVSKGGVVK